MVLRQEVRIQISSLIMRKKNVASVAGTGKLCHVFNHCLPHMQEIVSRHNKIVDRICKAVGNRWNIWKKNEVVGREGLKPDIILTNGSEAMIIDVTSPFENGPEQASEPVPTNTPSITA